MTITVEKKENNTFEILWDKNDPIESILNTWTEEDFIICITNYLNSQK